MTTKAKLGDALLKSLIERREQKGALSIEDMGDILEEMAATLQPGGSAADRFLQKEIVKMAQYLDDAKHQILSITPNENAGTHHISEASSQLDAVIKTTEDASNTIMDAADAIQGAIAGVGGQTEQQIMDATTRIYEACNFQDLTGQRLRKVIATLDYLDDQIAKLAGMFGGAEGEDAPQAKAAVVTSLPRKNDNRPDGHLMNGPQAPDKAPSQDDIDALFASVKI